MDAPEAEKRYKSIGTSYGGRYLNESVPSVSLVFERNAKTQDLTLTRRSGRLYEKPLIAPNRLDRLGGCKRSGRLCEN